MPKPQLIGPPTRSASVETQAGRSHFRAIPEDLLRDASRRLGIMSLVAAGLWFVGSVLGHIANRAIGQGGRHWLDLGVGDAIAAICIVVSLALFAYARRGNRNPQMILDFGVAYMVFMSVSLAVMFHLESFRHHQPVTPMISWIGVVVLMSAAIVPSAPVKMLVAGFIAVSMNPIAMLIARARGTWDFGPASNVLLMHYPDYLLAGVAVVISHVVTTLGQQVAKARELGSYQLGELLGRGGMGEVYKATHRMLARPAAIKLIRPEMLGGRDRAAAQLAVERFRREARAAANLRSPHTVELYDFGVTDDETLYFVMELLDGMDLESLVREHGPLPAARVIFILRQVCESLEEAHVQGLVHRDIKPANIHIGRLGLRHDFVKVLDFGLVKSMDGASAETSPATMDGLIQGTPAYMAPEMALGDAVDGRVDIYAVGCVAYYLLTGRQVFDADNAVQLITKHLQAEPVPPSARTDHPVPPALERIVLACLAKKPDDRPRSAAALSRSLAAIDGERWGDEDAAAWWSD